MIKSSLVDDLAILIRRRVQSERLEDGSFFMTEAQLAEEYSVSRKVAREAIGKLQALGLVQSRKRKGIVISKPDPLRLLADSLPSLTSSPDDLVDLAQFRYALEIGAIELAVIRATDSQIIALGEIESEMEQVLRAADQPHREVELDIRFHSLILEMTGSRMIAGMQRALSEFFIAMERRPTPIDRNKIEEIIWEHRSLYHAIRDRDIEGARALLRRQLQWLLDVNGLTERMMSLKRHEKENR